MWPPSRATCLFRVAPERFPKKKKGDSAPMIFLLGGGCPLILGLTLRVGLILGVRSQARGNSSSACGFSQIFAATSKQTFLRSFGYARRFVLELGRLEGIRIALAISEASETAAFRKNHAPTTQCCYRTGLDGRGIATNHGSIDLLCGFVVSGQPRVVAAVCSLKRHDFMHTGRVANAHTRGKCIQ